MILNLKHAKNIVQDAAHKFRTTANWAIFKNQEWKREMNDSII